MNPDMLVLALAKKQILLDTIQPKDDWSIGLMLLRKMEFPVNPKKGMSYELDRADKHIRILCVYEDFPQSFDKNYEDICLEIRAILHKEMNE